MSVPQSRHHIVLRIAAVALAVITLLALAPDSADAAARRRSRIGLTRQGRVVTVVGQHFPRQRRVRVAMRLPNGTVRTKVVRTRPGGRLVARFHVPTHLSGTVRFTARRGQTIRRRSLRVNRVAALQTSPTKVLFVVGAPGALNGSEKQVKSRMANKGYAVTVKDDDGISARAAEGHAAVVISKSVTSTKIGSSLRGIPAGILFWEDNLQINTYMGTSTHDGGGNGTAWHQDGSAIGVLAGAPRALTGGRSGSVAFYGQAQPMTHSPGGAIISGATKVANWPTDSSESVLYAVDKGVKLAGGDAARGRRYYFGLYDDTFRYLTTSGLSLFDLALAWTAAAATTTTTPPTDTTTSGGSTTPTDSTTTTPTTPTTPIDVSGTGVDATYSPVGTPVGVGALTQTLLDNSPEGTAFAIAPGVHRLSEPLRPRRGQQLLGLPGAVINGSVELTSWRSEGALWVADGQTQRLPRHGSCTTTGCDMAEDVFLDDQPLRQVMSLDAVTASSFYFDYTNSRIYVGVNPAGRRIETTVAPTAILGQRSGTKQENVVVRNLVIEKFGNRAQLGAIDTQYASGWAISNNEVRLNHGVGVVADNAAAVVGNRILRNGQMGVAGHGPGLLFERNEIAYNNWAGYHVGWEAGGAKWTNTDGLIVRGNWSHHNDGPGLWTDINNIRTTYEGNLVEDNTDCGIFHEISYDATITKNVIRRNGLVNPRWGYGAGIQISASPRVNVFGNTVSGNGRGITIIMQNRTDRADHGPHETRDISVYDNDISMSMGFSGLVQDVGDTSYFTSANNRFFNNRYTISGVAKPFEWNNGLRSVSEWKSFGNDVNGTFN